MKPADKAVSPDNTESYKLKVKTGMGSEWPGQIVKASEGNRTPDLLFTKQNPSLKLLNKLSVTDLATLSGLSKSYISQVKHGKRPASKALLECLSQPHANIEVQTINHLANFMRSREAIGCTPATMKFYAQITNRWFRDIDPEKANEGDISQFLMQFPNLGNRARFYQVIKTYYRWREQVYDIPSPLKTLRAPKIPKLILPSLTQGQVQQLIGASGEVRNKAIIALLTESGLRLSELTNIKASDIDWQNRTIQIIGKGRKEALAPFGELSRAYLTEWLAQYTPVGNIWGLNKWGIITMLRRLEAQTGLPCNPHTFRRTFACLLRKSGLDTMTIKDLGRWESLEMVQRYTRSVTFQDSLKFYKAPLSG